MAGVEAGVEHHVMDRRRTDAEMPLHVGFGWRLTEHALIDADEGHMKGTSMKKKRFTPVKTLLEKHPARVIEFFDGGRQRIAELRQRIACAQHAQHLGEVAPRRAPAVGEHRRERIDAVPRDHHLQLDRLRRGDWVGIACMAIGLGSLITVLEEGERKEWFGSPMIRDLAILAAIFIPAFVIIELWHREPFINLRLWARRGFARHIGTSITSGGIGKTELSMKEIAEEPSLRETGTVVEVDHPTRGTFRVPGCPIRLSASKPVITPPPLAGPSAPFRSSDPLQ